jgi:hypothetical protein
MLAIICLCLVVMGMTAVDAQLVIDFGNNSGSQLNQVNPASSISVLDVQESSSFTTGTLTTSGSGPVTFDLSIIPANGDVQGQDLAFGVTGGSAGLGVDNNINGSVLEALTFTISDFTGISSNESLVITHVTCLFGVTGETYTINGSGDVGFTTTEQTEPYTIEVPNDVTVTVGAGTAGDTRFGIDSITVDVYKEPPPAGTIIIIK